MAYTPPGETRRRIYRFMKERLLAGQPPTIREVQEAFGFRSVESARAQLDMLVIEGLLIKEEGKSRGYRLPGRERPPALVPLLGRVQAGRLSEAMQEPEGYLSIDTRAKADELFALRVRGESMTGAGIMPGDVVVVRRQPEAEPGDIVVAMVGEEATVKTLRRKGGRWVLLPENPDFPPIIPPPQTLVILGKVIEVRRYLEKLALIEANS